VLWCLVGGSASIVLGIRPDLMLLAGAVLLVLYAFAPNTFAGRTGGAAPA
jgi:hypothetical protein